MYLANRWYSKCSQKETAVISARLDAAVYPCLFCTYIHMHIFPEIILLCVFMIETQTYAQCAKSFTAVNVANGALY